MTEAGASADPELRGTAAVKISWLETDEGWTASLVATDGEGFLRVPLQPGVEFDLELTEERRCVGYFSGVGERRPCPEYRELDSGSQCRRCRRLDVFSGYVEGRTAAEVDPETEFAGYLARCGSAVKVGVTRTGKLERRWVEQGADEAVALRTGLGSEEALALESEVSKRYGLAERIRKEDKLRSGDVSLNEVVESRGIDVEGEILDITGCTVYPPLSCSGLSRAGRFSGRVESVKGQILSFDGRACVAATSGRVFRDDEQTDLADY